MPYQWQWNLLAKQHTTHAGSSAYEQCAYPYAKGEGRRSEILHFLPFSLFLLHSASVKRYLNYCVNRATTLVHNHACYLHTVLHSSRGRYHNIFFKTYTNRREAATSMLLSFHYALAKGYPPVIKSCCFHRYQAESYASPSNTDAATHLQ